MYRHRAHGWNGDYDLTRSVHSYAWPCAASTICCRLALCHVAVVTGRHARLEGVAQLAALAVDDHKAKGATPEGDCIVAVAPPVRNREVGRCEIAKAHHRCYVLPAVFAYPPPVEAIRRAVRVDRHGAPIGVGRRPLVRVGEIVARHHLRVTVGPGKHESVRQIIEPAVLEGDDTAARTVSALVVVVISEDNTDFTGQETPGHCELFQVGQPAVSEGGAYAGAIFELAHITDFDILFCCDRLAWTFDNFLVDVRPFAFRSITEHVQNCF